MVSRQTETEGRAVEKLIGLPTLGDALDSEAILCGLLDSSHDALATDESMNVDALVHAVLLALSRYTLLLRPEFGDRVSAYMRDGGERVAREFAIDLNRAFYRMLIAELRPPSAPVGFVTICETMEDHGIDVGVLLTVSGEEMRAWDRALWVVQRELYLNNPDSPARARLAAEKRIFNVFREHFEVRRVNAVSKAVAARTEPSRRRHKS